MDTFETVVLGLGAMGSAALYQLAKRGRKTLGLEQFTSPHVFGSSHGETRITRLAIGEGPHYTPLAMRSHEIWREIERATGVELLRQTGGLIISSPERTARLHVEDFFANTIAAAERFGIAHEILDVGEIRKRFPQFRVRKGEFGYYEPAAGFLRPERCIAAQLKLATELGAEIGANETVLAYEPLGGRVRVDTDRRSLVADTLIVAAGAWLPDLIGEKYAACFHVLRQVLFWFAVDDARLYETDRCPVYIWELQGPDQAIYGFPAIDGAQAIKVATQQYDHTTTPASVDREVSAGEIAAIYQTQVGPFFAGVRPQCVKAVTCLYTQTADAGFVICRHPEWDRVIIASPCSGHGFKHSAAIGETLAEFATANVTRFDLSAFSLERLLV